MTLYFTSSPGRNVREDAKRIINIFVPVPGQGLRQDFLQYEYKKNITIDFQIITINNTSLICHPVPILRHSQTRAKSAHLVTLETCNK